MLQIICVFSKYLIIESVKKNCLHFINIRQDNFTIELKILHSKIYLLNTTEI